jgi:hypothetical protein
MVRVTLRFGLNLWELYIDTYKYIYLEFETYYRVKYDSSLL